MKPSEKDDFWKRKEEVEKTCEEFRDKLEKETRQKTLTEVIKLLNEKVDNIDNYKKWYKQYENIEFKNKEAFLRWLNGTLILQLEELKKELEELK